MSGLLPRRSVGLECEGIHPRGIKPMSPITGRETLASFILPHAARRLVYGRVEVMLSVFAQCRGLEQWGTKAFVLPCLPSRTLRWRGRAEAAASPFASASAARPSASSWASQIYHLAHCR